MSSPRTETEVKIYVPALDALRDKLENSSAKLVQERVYERNVRYDLEDGSLTSRGVVLRLREDVGVTLTYKEPGIIERGIITREEIEVELSDFDAMQSILGKLGYNESMVYEKYRTTYHCHNAEIMLDELPYGTFIEVEGATEDIEFVLSEFGLTDEERRGDSYAKLFDYVKHHLELTFKDLTFKNFEGIDVPESAFIPPGSIVIR
ncbi:MAG: class IV adenylate cyclase [Chloroflexota bacterium]